MKKNYRILVLDGEQRSALAATRSLGSNGYRIIVGSEDIASISGASKYCYKQIQYSSPYIMPDRFIEEIKDSIRDYKVDILWPMTDISVFTVLNYEKDFKTLAVIPCGPLENYLKASDKVLLAKMAMRMGVPVPQSIFVDNPDEVTVHKSKIEYPVVLKPHSSLIRHKDKIYKRGVHIVNSYNQLKRAVNNNIAFTQPFMIQEKIEGEGIGIFALFDHGKPVAVFSHRRLREKPPWGGVSVLSESTKPDPSAREFAVRMLKALDWHGVAMVEFKRDNSKSGLPMLMEINARFWGSLQLSIDAGIDFPYLLTKQCEGEKISRIDSYRYSRLRWLLGDFDNLYITLKNKLLNTKSSYLKKNKLLYVVNFFKEFIADSKLEVLRKDDIKPFFRELKQYIEALFKP